MPSGRATINTRPIRFAFYSDTRNTEEIVRSIELATMLWGGPFAPIIPTVAPLARTAAQGFSYRIAYDDHVARFLKQYDPDVIIALDPTTAAGLGDVGGRAVVSALQVFDGLAAGWEQPGYGLGLFQITRQIIFDELTYLRRVPLKFVLPQVAAEPSSLFLNAVFGCVPGAARPGFLSIFDADIKPADVSVTTSDFSTFFGAPYQYPIRLATRYIRVRHTSGEGGAIFFLDSSDSQDVVEFWNIRARGRSLFPFPVQHKSSPDLIEAASAYARANTQTWAGEARVDVYCSSSQEPEALGGVLRKLKENAGCGVSILRMPEWLLDERPERYSLSVGTRNVSVGEGQTQIEIEFTTKFMRGVDLKKVGPSIANQIDFRFYSNHGKLAEVVPSGDSSLLRAFNAFDDTSWRLSPRGLIHYSRYPVEEENIKLPESDDIIKKWFQSRGYAVVESGSGKIARQIFKLVSNGDALSLLSEEPVVRILED